MKWDYCIGNPPYQIETLTKDNTKQDVISRKSIFQYFQKEVENIANKICLIYPAKRWLLQSGKGMQSFGKWQINDLHLTHLYIYPNAAECFPGIGISDGISIVFKNMLEEKDQFDYHYIIDSKEIIIKMSHPGDNIIAIDPNSSVIIDKITEFVAKYQLTWLNGSIQPQKLFSVESNFVEENPDKVRVYKEGEKLADDEIKLLTNDKSGSKGKPHWYVIKRKEIKTGQELFDKYIVILPSVSLCRLHQLDLIYPNEIFGRAKIGIKSFDTEKEARMFIKYVSSIFINFCFLLTGGSLTTGGKLVPDLQNYKNNTLIDFNKNIDDQFKQLLNLTKEEWDYIQAYVNENVKRNKFDIENEE